MSISLLTEFLPRYSPEHGQCDNEGLGSGVAFSGPNVGLGGGVAFYCPNVELGGGVAFNGPLSLLFNCVKKVPCTVCKM